MHLIKVTVVASDTGEAINALNELAEVKGVVAVSISLPQDAEEFTPSRVQTPFGPRLSVADGFAVFYMRGEVEIRQELSEVHFSMLTLFSKQRLFHSHRELHDALAEHDPRLFARRAPATVRRDYSTLAVAVNPCGWDLAVGQGALGYAALL